jgi:serine/threonine kinase 16
MGNESLPWPFSERNIFEIILGTAKALHVIHTAGFSHRDVKPHNILLDDATSPLGSSDKTRINPVLMDLGSVSTAKVEIRSRRDAVTLEEMAASKTSAAFRAAELTQVPYPASIDERVDIFGLGCTMYCLAFGWSPFESAAEGVKRLAILNGRYSFPNQYVTSKDGSKEIKIRNCNFSQRFCDFISDMLQHDHCKRPFAHDVIRMCEMHLR